MIRCGLSTVYCVSRKKPEYAQGEMGKRGREERKAKLVKAAKQTPT